MQVVLLERIEKLGQMGDVVKVKDGFARNFLLPRKKALRATKENITRFEGQRAQLEARNLELKKEAEQVLAKVEGQSFIVLRQAGETGVLYGSVSTRDISDAMTTGGFSTARNQVVLDKPIKTIGLHPVRIVLHPEVSATITINVARTEEEAKRQAAGEDLTGRQDEAEEEAVEAAEFFESEELAPKDGEDEADAAEEAENKE
ncbi:MAG: 50S ribosomal protein L9 [Parvibaculum sp.]|nr:50S ribosomal protein L9 [Parvibaculum sp.]